MFVAVADMHGEGAAPDQAPRVDAAFARRQLSKGARIGADDVRDTLRSPPVVPLGPVDGTPPQQCMQLGGHAVVLGNKREFWGVVIYGVTIEP